MLISRETISISGRRLTIDNDTRDSPEVSVMLPDPSETDGEIVAVGGELSPEILLSAYRRGIFPWFTDGEPILWWSLNPRFILHPKQIRLSKKLRRHIRRSAYRFTLDAAFPLVIGHCREVKRPAQKGTWITNDMVKAYTKLNELGYAHSVETWKGEELAGGLYGVALGGCFYGESMFTLQPEASKLAFAALVGALIDADFGLIDCQQHTQLLSSFGAVDIPRKRFLGMLALELKKPTFKGNWKKFFPEFPKSALWNSFEVN
ncbi:leucyl/phenylalanyl-tRNA--protein transferase [Olavius algarvensis spirochete endosymbiont]|uniref:leucyl/phenylalanyl-tRNA--protein transferase n=1 Tax=Olavius algarvensis spirochete endosymbiont TaxID=260710 RepID=UPI001E39D5BA|nr:leucyl/phenylalanyl-tRNA--protein transferase [Olavius algarvensis spirochete endosymbiont]